MKIYTKAGDSGYTALVGGQRVEKSHIRIEAYGTVDELISFIGLVHDTAPNPNDQDFSIWIQDRLMVIASLLATSDENLFKQLPTLSSTDYERLEFEIDDIEKSLPPLTNFILPGGHVSISYSHVCRSICRRCERQVFRLSKEADIDPVILIFLNRLSDYLFVLARKFAQTLKIQEIIWNPKH